jgi:hypothetical protein
MIDIISKAVIFVNPLNSYFYMRCNFVLVAISCRHPPFSVLWCSDGPRKVALSSFMRCPFAGGPDGFRFLLEPDVEGEDEDPSLFPRGLISRAGLVLRDDAEAAVNVSSTLGSVSSIEPLCSQ